MLIYKKPATCVVCGAGLAPAFQRVRDRVYGVPGEWDIDRCSNDPCGVLHLAHDLSVEQLASFYATYSTHSPAVLDATGLKGLYRKALKHIAHRRLGYPTRASGRAVAVARLLDAIPFFREMALSRVFWLPYRPGGTVIEVGFGNGQGMALLREAGWNVRGSEFDETCVSLAREMSFDAVQGEFTAGIFAAGVADAIVASHVIEHVPDPQRFFLEAWRVLRPGGQLVLRTPNAASDDAHQAGRDWRGLEVPRHLTIHTPSSLLNLAGQTGFRCAVVKGTPLGGFIAQQSRELRDNEAVASRQSRKTVIFDALETAKWSIHDDRCAEIVLMCEKPAG